MNAAPLALNRYVGGVSFFPTLRIAKRLQEIADDHELATGRVRPTGGQVHEHHYEEGAAARRRRY
jgi:hypothetical protein